MPGFLQKSLGLFSCRQICGEPRWTIAVISLVCLMLATTSCGNWAELKADTYESSEKEFRNAERAYYKHPGSDPEYCIALSGGGIRSAAYSIGVLKGLHVLNKLPHIDIISAVSGGSFAATWLFAEYEKRAQQGSSKEAALAEIFSPTSIEKVAENVKYFGARQLGNSAAEPGKQASFAWNAVDTLVKFAAGAWDWISGPVVFTGQFIWSELNIPPRYEGYRTGNGELYESLLREYFHSSLDTKKQSIQTASTDLPYLIVNATIQGVIHKPKSSQGIRNPDSPESDGTSNGIRLANKVFEFTRNGIGSPSVGYKSWAKLKADNQANTHTDSYSTIAAISGAFIDPSVNKWMRSFIREAGLGYGMLALNPSNNKTNEFFLLTDGGNSENLGVYGLMERNCKEIVAVDAEYDGIPETVTNSFYRLIERVTGRIIVGYEDTYQFEAYGKLKANLQNEGEPDAKWNTITIHKLDDLKPSDPEGRWSCWSKPVKTGRQLFDCSKGPIREREIFVTPKTKLVNHVDKTI